MTKYSRNYSPSHTTFVRPWDRYAKEIFKWNRNERREKHIKAKSIIMFIYKVFPHKLDMHKFYLALATDTSLKSFVSPHQSYSYFLLLFSV